MSTFARLGLTILTAAFIAGCTWPGQGREVIQTEYIERVSEQEGIVERAAKLDESGQVALFAAQTLTACHNIRSQLPAAAASWKAQNLASLLSDGGETNTTSAGLLSQNQLESSAIVAQEFGRTMRYQASVPVRLAYIEAQSEATRQTIASFNCEEFNATVAEITKQKKNTADAWASGIKTVGYTILGGLALNGLDNVLTGAIAAAAQPSNSTVINGDNNATGTAGRDQNDVNVSTAGGIPVNSTDLAVTASEGEASEETNATTCADKGGTWRTVRDSDIEAGAPVYDGFVCSDGNSGYLTL